MTKRPWTILVVLIAVVVLALLVARPTSGAGRETRHVVRPGDTLWQIAEERYAGDPREGVWRIAERNRLETPLITPGMVLVLPP